MVHTTPSAVTRVLRVVVTVGLVAVAIGTVAIGLMREGSRASEAAASSAAAVPRDEGTVIVYYFHGDTRCETCLAIEAKTSEIVNRVFAEEISSGWLRFESVNYDEPANRHFREEYELAYGSVVVQGASSQGSWKNLADVWTLIHQDGTDFEDYLTRHILSLMDPVG